MTQLKFPFPFTQKDLTTYLERHLSIDREQARLAETLAALKTEWQDDLPLRAIATALKVVKARKKLAEHQREPMSYEQQAHLERYVLEAVEQQDAETARLVAEALGAGKRG